MVSTGDERRDEQFAHRFAASFLVPAEAARRELGAHRRDLSIDELGLLKQRWGLSMQGWIRRASDLGIISTDLYRTLNIQFRSRGWNRKEPGPIHGERIARPVPQARAARPVRGHDHFGRGRAPLPGRLQLVARAPGKPACPSVNSRDNQSTSGTACSAEAVIGVDADETDWWDAVAGDDVE